MLSLSPRYDLFKFSFPKDFLPEDVQDKYNEILSKNQGVITNCLDYLNESIQGVNMPGISDILVTQEQPGERNSITRSSDKINVEPKHDMTWVSAGNPLEKISKEFKVTFRFNQGLYNYFMLYETIFYRMCKPELYPSDKVLYIEILDETGKITARIKFYDVNIDGIDGIEFNYNKIERDAGTFDVTFKFNNIDFEFVDLNI
jgi:hypothetical protein